MGIANTITRTILTLGMKLAMEYNQMERGVGLVRALGQGSTDFSPLAKRRQILMSSDGPI